MSRAGQPLDDGEHVLLARDRLGEALLGDIGRDRQARRERLVLAAERAVELAQQVGAEAGGERRARQVDDVADALQADARQRRDRLGRQPQRRERQRREQARARRPARRSHGCEMRRGPGRADGRRDGGARREAEARHAREQVVAQLCLAAEEMRAAADVEQDAVGRIDGDERRVALAPVGDGVEQARVGGLVLRHGGERGMHGARLRQRQAGAQAEPLRRRIDRDQHVGIAALADNDDGEGGARRPSRVPYAHCRAMRSVESRASHRLRMRCEDETLLHTVPLHDPCSEMSAAIAHEARGEPRRADAVRRRRGRRRADDPARRGGGRRIVRRGAQEQAERVAGRGREREPPRRHPIDVARARSRRSPRRRRGSAAPPPWPTARRAPRAAATVISRSGARPASSRPGP